MRATQIFRSNKSFVIGIKFSSFFHHFSSFCFISHQLSQFFSMLSFCCFFTFPHNFSALSIPVVQLESNNMNKYHYCKFTFMCLGAFSMRLDVFGVCFLLLLFANTRQKQKKTQVFFFLSCSFVS